MTFRIAMANAAIYVADAVEPGDTTIPVYARAELGIRPDHETVHLVRRLSGTVDTWDVDRALEGTSAEAWPIGSPLALVPAGEDPTGAATVHLAHALASDARAVNLQGCYRRLRIDAEIVWDASIFGERRGTPNSERASYWHTVERGREGTTEASHAAGSVVTALGPGET